MSELRCRSINYGRPVLIKFRLGASMVVLYAPYVRQKLDGREVCASRVAKTSRKADHNPNTIP